MSIHCLELCTFTYRAYHSNTREAEASLTLLVCVYRQTLAIEIIMRFSRGNDFTNFDDTFSLVSFLYIYAWLGYTLLWNCIRILEIKSDFMRFWTSFPTCLHLWPNEHVYINKYTFLFGVIRVYISLVSFKIIVEYTLSLTSFLFYHFSR